MGLRIAMRPDGRAPPLASEPAYVKGLVEVQDEGSQLAALLAEAKPGMQVLDLCAGAGGKTLALAAAMENQGQIYAADPDAHRLAPIFARLARSGARNVQVRAPRGQADVLADLKGRCDLVLIDAPCTGSGAWRRNPDAKWRIRPGALEQRIKDQDETLESALRFVKQGGRIVYVTCSVLRAENEDRIAAFMASPRRSPADRRQRAGALGRPAGARRASVDPRPRLSPQPESDRHGRVLYRDLDADVRGRMAAASATPRAEIASKPAVLSFPRQAGIESRAGVHSDPACAGVTIAERGSRDSAAARDLLCLGQSARVNASYLQPFFSLYDAEPDDVHAPDRVHLQLDCASMDRPGRGWGQSGAQDRKPADQPRGDGEILGCASGRRSRLGGAVRADILISQVTVSRGFGKLAAALG